MDINSLINTALELKRVSDFNKYVKMYGVDSYASIERCWWNDKEFSCNEAFLNLLFDNKLCFMFNPNTAFNSFIQGGKYCTTFYCVHVTLLFIRSEKCEFIDSFGYGLNGTNNTQRTIVNSGKNNGLRILLNTHQEEYCGVLGKWSGAGFNVLIQDYQRP